MSEHQADHEWVETIAAQIGTGTMPDNDQWTNRFTCHSRSSSAVYTVAQRKTSGEWGCSCPGWTRHVDAKGRRKCKHLTDILQRLAAHNVLADAVAAEGSAAPPSVVTMLSSAQSAYDLLGGIR
jgi:hypothetical protein